MRNDFFISGEKVSSYQSNPIVDEIISFLCERSLTCKESIDLLNDTIAEIQYKRAEIVSELKIEEMRKFEQ